VAVRDADALLASTLVQTSDPSHTSARARHRLSAVTADEPLLPEPEHATEAPPEPGPARPRGWRERWLPASWRGARADPGRRGALALAGVAALAAVLAAVGVWRDRPVPQAVPALAPVVVSAPAASPTGPAPTGELVVSVAGAVAAPGLVTLPAGARVADALTAAGGALPGTDLLTLNLAQPLTDGEQVLVGVVGPPAAGAAPAAKGAPAAGGAPARGPSAAGGLVNLNTATQPELEELPGVGPVMAAAIIAFRTQNGPFTSVEQLDDVSGVGAARLAQLVDLVTV
jgi:competence protein ComEA